MVILVIFGLVFKYRKFLKIWCFIKFGWKFDRNEDADDANRPYDAFVSYSSKDAGIVVREILPRLTHLSLASLLWDIGKQYSPRCDAEERGVPSGAILFAYRNFIEKWNKI